MKNKKKEIVEIEIPSKSLRIKHGMCGNRHSLMNEEHLIGGFPSISVLAKFGDKEGLIFLDPVYGSYKNIWDITVPDGEIVELFCPHCGVSLCEQGQICDECLSPIFAVYLPQGGAIEACTRNGCYHHSLKFTDSDEIGKKLLEENYLDHMF
jgi:hypothetical protein